MRDAERLTGRIIVCSPALLPAFFTDDLFGVCAFCGQRVRFRPYTPAPRALVCLGCFLVRADPGETCEILGGALEELAALAPDVPKC